MAARIEGVSVVVGEFRHLLGGVKEEGGGSDVLGVGVGVVIIIGIGIKRGLGGEEEYRGTAGRV